MKIKNRIQLLKDLYFDENSCYPKEHSENALIKLLIDSRYSKDPTITLESRGYFIVQWVFQNLLF